MFANEQMRNDVTAFEALRRETHINVNVFYCGIGGRTKHSQGGLLILQNPNQSFSLLSEKTQKE